MILNRPGHIALATLALAAILSACGGGGADTTPRAPVSSLKVMGDSLADVGTFGIKFTIQGNDTYPERVAQTYGLSKGCSFFKFTGTTFVPNTTPGCTNYAVGGGVINPVGSGLSTADPRGLPVQMATATAAGNFGANDLLLIDGGGNDAATLVGAYLAAGKDGGVAYTTVLGTVLTPEQVAAAVAGGSAGLASAGTTYMTALADNFYNLIKTGALDKGAQRVALLNMPGITNTPRFQLVLDSVAAATTAAAKAGGATDADAAAAGAAARASSETLFKGWVSAFNARLASKFAGDTRVAVVDFYTEFNNQIATPAQFALTNVKTPACPATGVGTDGLPTYDFLTCTDASLAAKPPAGSSNNPDWYKTYAFSDGFHPTPYGHQLLAQLISRTLAQAGWL
ncbi:SGNH/GDSL hydrolase family protein [Ideonella paludis]|uniref:SGNH/GDSL hydrolase family protein n=2 Tax=Ideonella paludis TaxID=1233411 RepID=A0ABS5DWB0_9BURK|nr:SGNH/GDSL hydrolase family protein [Ideonella paludis]MBQ0935389.1 SGNH/GDSL hydrolase family protein [Ideonella paludis]